MGFFDKLKNKNKKNISSEVNKKQPEKQLPFEVKYSNSSNRNLQVDFYDKNADFKKLYDTTRLIVDREPFNIEGHKIYDCVVSWYGYDDCQVLYKTTGKLDSIRARAYREVLAEIDLEQLKNNPNYCEMVMKGLLDQQRVAKYLERGLQENPEIPCGQYIGGVRKTERGYGKFFSVEVGKASHNSKQMINIRKRHREMIENQRRKEIEYKKTQIKRLQDELANMER